MKLYAPKVETLIPAFYGTILTIPFTPSQYNSTSDYNGMVLYIKDPMQQDAIIIACGTCEWDLDKHEVYFDLEQQTDKGEVLIEKMLAGYGYKCVLAYANFIDTKELIVKTATIGQTSNAFVVKYLGETGPRTAISLSSDFTVSFNYQPPVQDLSEKIYSVKYELLDADTDQVLEVSDETIINYSKIFLANDQKVSLQYEFTPQFTYYSEMNLSQDYIEELFAQDGSAETVPIYDFIDNEYVLNFSASINRLQSLGLLEGQKYYAKAIFTTLSGLEEIITNKNEPQQMTWYEDLEDYSIVVQSMPDYGYNDIKIIPRNTTYTLRDIDVNKEKFRILRKNNFTGETRFIGSTFASGTELFNTLNAGPIAASADIRSKIGIIDFDIEHGVEYTYVLQFIDKAKVNQLTYAKSKNIVNNFEDIYICDSTHILCLRFNPKVTGYKTTIQQTKTETLGSAYPMIFRNAHIGYQEFTVNTLVSYLADTQCLFINGMTDQRYNYIRNRLRDAYTGTSSFRTGYQIENVFMPTTSLTDENKFMEREYRRAVIEWLNNGEVKMFKSPVEQNHLVCLNNISATPEDKTGRMLCTVSAQAIEVEAYNTENVLARNMTYYHTT